MTTLREFFEAECPKHQQLPDLTCLRCKGAESAEVVDFLESETDRLQAELETMEHGMDEIIRNHDKEGTEIRKLAEGILEIKG